ncbi:MAG: DJ-1/PfpI family protein [Cyanobacteria bacterium P01_A01_bin.45]
MSTSTKFHIGLILYPGMTQLDMTAPHQVFALLPGTCIHLLWKNLDAVTSNEGMKILPTTTFSDCPQLDVICVPGGGMGQVEVMTDREVIEFLQQQSKKAKYITSVCTGSLILAAAGLLQGYKAACHWAFRDYLAQLGVEVSTQRVVQDRDRITGGGITAGIDFALVIATELYGEETAKMIQLLLEYNPAPPFSSGSPEIADVATLEQVKDLAADLFQANSKVVQQIVPSLKSS